jgi:hypothetical protein
LALIGVDKRNRVNAFLVTEAILVRQVIHLLVMQFRVMAQASQSSETIRVLGDGLRHLQKPSNALDFEYSLFHTMAA